MKSNRIADYMKWLISQIREIQKHTPQNNHIYKIVGKEFCKKTNEEKLAIQVAGKSVFVHFTPHELVKDEVTLKGFSPLDVRTITYLACNAEQRLKSKKPLYQIVAQFFSRNKGEETFIIQSEKENKRIIKSAQEISSNPHLIDGLNSQDAHRIGYVSGSEQVATEIEFFIKEKANNSLNKKEKSLYKIIAQFFSRNKKEETFIIQTDKSSTHVVKSAQEISNDPILINKLASEDAHRVGYITGIEQMIIEKNYPPVSKKESID
jgi:hypothetical protein